MDAQILHSGFDGLKFTIQTDIPATFRDELASAKNHARATHGDCVLEFGPVALNVTSKGARGFTVANSVQFAVLPALCAAGSAGNIPPLSRRCALMCVASVIGRSGGPFSATRAVNT